MDAASNRGALVFTVGVGVVLALLAWLGRDFLVAPLAGGPAPAAAASPTATPTPKAPRLIFDLAAGRGQAPRFLSVRFTSSEPLAEAQVRLEPDPGVACRVELVSSLGGSFGCDGFLAPATDYVARLGLRSGAGASEVRYPFRTMGARLTGVKWFTEFEDPAGDPLACAAASMRSVALFTVGEDRTTAAEILATGRRFNRSDDPGLDPVAIATTLKRIQAGNNYHYYRSASREEATAAAVYWLLRSAKPVIALTLAGEHAPLVVGYGGAFGTHYGDPTNRIDGVAVIDPQRGDLDPRTQSRRPDKYRTADFQTGRLLGLEEWYGDEWWFRFPFSAVISTPRGRVNVERSDGAYPLPHWGGHFVILVNDSDAEWPSDREGRVRFR